MWTTFLPILPTPIHTPAHVVSHINTGVGAGVIRVHINIQTVLIGVTTLEAAVCVVAVRGPRKHPTFIAEITSCILGAGLTRWYATEIKTYWIIDIIRSTMTFNKVIHTLVATSFIKILVITSIIVKRGRLFLVIFINNILVTVSDGSEGQGRHQHQRH